MCLTFLVYGCHPPQPRLLLAFNRDEFLRRPAQPLHVWDEDSSLLAGRDLGSGGTWLGINTRTGRLALLTNLRSHDPIAPTFSSPTNCASRGGLVTGFLVGSASPSEYAQSIPGDRYNGFNLVVGDLSTNGAFAYTNNGGDSGSDAAVCGTRDVGGASTASVAGPPSVAAAATISAAAVSRRGSSSSCGMPTQIRMLEPGQVYGLSNGRLMEWPKVATGVDVLRRLLPSVTSDRGVPYDRIFGELMGDSRRLVPPRGMMASADDGSAGGAGGDMDDAGAAVQPPAATGAATAIYTATAKGRGVAEPPAETKPGPDDAGCSDYEARQQQVAAATETATAEMVRRESAAREPRGGDGGVGCGGSQEVLDVAGFKEQLEHITSGRFVSEVQTPFGPYGTRSQVVIVVWHDGSAEARERHRGDSGAWRDVVVTFKLGSVG